MRTLIVPAVALAMSVSSVALAQGQQGGSPQGGSPQQSGQTAGQSGGQQSQQASTRSYKEVEEALKQAGIQDVRTLNAAYLVSAVTKDGEQVTFVVDPPAASAGAQSGNGSQQGNASGQQSGNQQSSGGQQGGASGQQMALRGQQQVIGDLKKAGFTNVQILDAAYLATGKTKNNDEITMMIDPTSAGGSGQSASSQ